MEHELILTLAEIAEITYDDPKVSRNKFRALGYDIIKFFDVEGAQAYLLRGDHYVLSFRGTQATKINDIIADVRFLKHKEPTGGRVHIGFKTELDKLWSSIEEEIQKIDQKLYVTGHSLGAAMATIAAGRLQDKAKLLVTFGSPRVGNRSFIENVNVDHFRVQNDNDDVTKVPPYVFGYRHHGKHVYLDYEGNVIEDKFWSMAFDLIKSRIKGWKEGTHFKGLSDHFMKNYIDKLSGKIK